MKPLLLSCALLLTAACGDLVTVDLDTTPDGPVRGDYRTMLDGIPATVTARGTDAEVVFEESGKSRGYSRLFALADTELRRTTGCREVRILSRDAQANPFGTTTSLIFELDECPPV
ncbi:hypothetical protein [Thalassobius sp. Cn5-15]|uniref:hypothetical protein n=1 Tax=Thalassobius sp. Cn5-15 TaxID=2917763 RepID=UPI001EF39CF7|nr:hypothetical protein [Thalassobius sp. Cn5-15]MCG7494517.1 hypothetical protein [Thalassobius sp. Cn5-15]